MARCEGSSSTTSIERGATRGGASAGTGFGISETETDSTGIETRKTLPSPIRLSSSNVPPSSSTRRDTTASPNPLPSLPAVSALENSSNILFCSSGAMPHPVSLTANSNRSGAPFPSPDRTTAESVTDPRSVNFTALESRLISTCLIRAASALTYMPFSARLSLTSDTPFLSAEGTNMPRV